MEIKAENKRRQGLWERIKALLLITLLALIGNLLWGCSDGDEPRVTVENVLVVYLGGDNNLSGEAGEKLSAIARGYEGAAGRRILVYQDAAWGASLCEITGKNQIEPLETYGPENSASEDVFSRVLRQAAERYPGAGFNLLVFSHASGWMPEGSYANPDLRSVVTDGRNEMELSGLAAAIPDGMFTYIVFEACYTAGIEVVYELRNKGKYIIGSSAEIVSPGFTSVYESAVNELVGGNPQMFAEMAFDWFSNQSGYLSSATFSVIETGKLSALADFVRNNCDFNREAALDELQFFDRNTDRLFCDFEDYYSRLLETEQQQQKLARLIKDCVIRQGATPSFMLTEQGFVINKHSGLTSYVMQERYPKLNTSYQALSWYKAIRALPDTYGFNITM